MNNNQDPDEIIKIMKNNLDNYITSDDKESRLIVRKSGTENKIRIMVESSDQNTVEKIISEAVKIFNEKCQKETTQPLL